MEKVKQTKTPRNAESITKGAMALPLLERIELRNKLMGSIAAELGDLKATFEQAEKIANGNK